MAIVRQIGQSCLDGLGGVVNAGVPEGRDGVALLEHDQCLFDNHAIGKLDIQAGILDEASYLRVSIKHHQRFGKFAVRDCEKVLLPL